MCLLFWEWLESYEGYVPDCLLQKLVPILVSELTGYSHCFQVLFLLRKIERKKIKEEESRNFLEM